MTLEYVKSLEDERIGEILERLERQLAPSEAAFAVTFARELLPGSLPRTWPSGGRWTSTAPRSDRGGSRAARSAGEPRLRVYNPTLEEHGWQSTHTVVEIVNDDMPFLVDSVSMALNRRRLAIHLILHPVIAVRRTTRARSSSCTVGGGAAPSGPAARVDHADRDRPSHRFGGPRRLWRVLEQVLDDARVAVGDWQPMRDRLRRFSTSSRRAAAGRPGEVAETAAFLEWMDQDHFVIVVIASTTWSTRTARTSRCRLQGPASASCATGGARARRRRPRCRRERTALAREREPLILTKANARSTIHRPIRLDYVGVKRFDAAGRVVGERRFLGIYTQRAYNSNPWVIPIVRRKVEHVLERSGVRPPLHAGKAMVQILETMPRDELFQASEDELVATTLGILRLEDRQRVRLFLRPDRYHRFFAALVFVPRDRYNTETREKIQRILLEELGGSEIEFSLSLSESILARIYFVVLVGGGLLPAVDAEAIERRIAEAVRDWRDELELALHERFGEERGSALVRRWAVPSRPATATTSTPAPRSPTSSAWTGSRVLRSWRSRCIAGPRSHRRGCA